MAAVSGPQLGQMDCDCNRAMFKEVLEAGVEQGERCVMWSESFLETANGTVDADRGLTIVRHVHETRSDCPFEGWSVYPSYSYAYVRVFHYVWIEGYCWRTIEETEWCHFLRAGTIQTRCHFIVRATCRNVTLSFKKNTDVS